MQAIPASTIDVNPKVVSKGYKTLVIRTTNGVVVVSGTVDKVEDIQKISNLIKDVEGVKSVDNQLSVRNR
ncbi:MAG: BON domain-containing protein [Parachlamydiaceae bacterium]|nr:BON domain-containing protein [Parachlamydiaceae bacterium]